MVDVGTVAVVVATTVVVVWRLLAIDRRSAQINTNVGTLIHQVGRWQAAHDHQVTSMDRRMCDVEASTARAERETRILSIQLVGPEGFARRVERLEAWVAHLAQVEGER